MCPLFGSTTRPAVGMVRFISNEGSSTASSSSPATINDGAVIPAISAIKL